MTKKIKCSKFVRIVGYYGNLKDANDGKQLENAQRKYLV